MTSTDRLSEAPNFELLGVTFRCWITDDGQRFEWRSTCGRFRAGRVLAVCWSRAGDRIVGKGFKTLRLAMEAAIETGARKRA